MTVDDIRNLVEDGKLDEAEKLCLKIFANPKPFPFQIITQYTKLSVQQKKVEAAISVLEGLCKRFPKVAGLYDELGRLYSVVGQFDTAIISAKKALEITPDSPDYYNNYGNILRHLERFSEAAQCYQKTAKLAPHLFMGHVNLGRCQLKLGQVAEAGKSFTAAVNIADIDKELVLGLAGTAYASEELYEAAIDCFKKGLSLNHNNPDLQEAIALAYRKQGSYELADASFNRAIELDPENSGYLNNYGLLLRDTGNWDMAVEVTLTAIDINPKNAEAMGNLGNLYRRMEQPEKALEMYERSLSLEPELINIHCSRAKIHTFVKGDGPLTAMASLLGKEGLSDEDRAKLQLSLGKAMDDVGEYSAAFGLYSSANVFYAKSNQFNAENHRRYMVRCAEVFNIPKLVSDGNSDGPIPVIVIGMSRSGKTQIEKVLKTSSLVHGMDEDKEFVELFNQLVKENGTTKPYPDCVSEINQRVLEEFGQSYLKKLQAKDPEAKFFVNTIPANFAFIGLMFQCLPGLIVINCERNPLDQALETYFKHYQEGNKYSYRMQDVGEFWLHYRSLMRHWTNLYGDKMHTLTYEALMTDTEETVHSIFEFCGLKNPPSVSDLNFNKQYIGRSKNYTSELATLTRALKQVQEVR
ncbi:hypothetical protein A9Q83_13525 [Alphaproteobacteria bacterium 46_93_T64]|nr:hypothetical protein A9Q83_13525 [Alphaproteobacteria bacterium 46_93_T64]